MVDAMVAGSIAKPPAVKCGLAIDLLVPWGSRPAAIRALEDRPLLKAKRVGKCRQAVQ